MGGPGSGRKAGTTPPPSCGTLSKVRWHERRHEQLDEACAEARRAKDRQRQQIPCSCGCGARVWVSRNSRPADEVMTKACASRTGRPNVWPEPTERLCGGCGATFIARWASRRCASCAGRDAERYNHEHRRERRRRLDERGPDASCARCGELLPEDEAGIDLDHLDGGGPRDYLGLSHSSCNRSKRPVVAELLAS